MCGGVYYSVNGRDMRVYYPNPRAMLPVRSRNGESVLVAWGRRPHQAGDLPLGGWARLDAVYGGRWDRWFPVPVKLPVRSFMEKDFEGRGHWYDLTRGQWVQGLVARCRQERRVYVVTVEPELADAIHERWPRIMSG
jgi:hypothetical protein